MISVENNKPCKTVSGYAIRSRPRRLVEKRHFGRQLPYWFANCAGTNFEELHVLPGATGNEKLPRAARNFEMELWFAKIQKGFRESIIEKKPYLTISESLLFSCYFLVIFLLFSYYFLVIFL